MTRVEQRRLQLIEAMFAMSAEHPVLICHCVASLENGRPLWPTRSLAACGEHPQSGVMCGNCHRNHDRRADLRHRVHTADLNGCIRCDHPAVTPENDGWVDVALPSLTVFSELAPTLYDLGAVEIAVNIASRLCTACRAKSA